MTAIFLPPVVAALYSPTVGASVFSTSDSLAIYLLNGPLSFADLNIYLQQQYNLEGAAYALMWFGIAVPVGWLLGILVTFADLVRPTASSDED
jgi:hypothetical protein